jgi:protein-tyrosine phosphatase
MIPFEKSYYVVPNKLIAGEIPTSIIEQVNKEKLFGIKNANIKAVINLMEADEKDHYGNLFIDYEPTLLSYKIEVTRFPITDMDIPSPFQMMKILNQINQFNKQGKIVYIHCWGGLGRTGTVVGCYLLQNRLASVDNVFNVINKLKGSSGLEAFESPQTTAQKEFILDWI